MVQSSFPFDVEMVSFGRTSSPEQNSFRYLSEIKHLFMLCLILVDDSGCKPYKFISIGEETAFILYIIRAFKSSL